MEPFSDVTASTSAKTVARHIKFMASDHNLGSYRRKADHITYVTVLCPVEPTDAFKQDLSKLLPYQLSSISWKDGRLIAQMPKIDIKAPATHTFGFFRRRHRGN